MEFIEGRSALEEVYEADDPDTALLQILAQNCLLLAILEDMIHLDHRDLKMTNLWIRKVAVDYRVSIGGVTWKIQAPFQVVILDFGFACIGDGFGKAIVNLGDVIPDMDPCPKDGRDLYQCIMSLLSVEKVKQRLSTETQAMLRSWVGSTGSLTWTYLITAHPRFRLNNLRPLNLLTTLSQFGGHIALNET
jgi:serine/threonine protein kinase